MMIERNFFFQDGAKKRIAKAFQKWADNGMLSQNPLKLLDISYFWNEQRHLVLVKSTSRISFLLHPLDGSG